MSLYQCEVCDFIFNEDEEGLNWSDLPLGWVCPVCESDKSFYHKIDNTDNIKEQTEFSDADLNKFIRTSDDLEVYMSDIHQMAESGTSIIEPMRTKTCNRYWEDVLIKGAQLATVPLNSDEAINTKTIIGPKSNQPLIIETPVFISHMSFGALSKEAKIALAKGSAAAKTAMCSGEGGILPESLENSYKYIFEYVPNKYSATEENFKKVDAIEIKIGQSSKPGMGGHLPANKVTTEIATIRGFKEGEDIISPSHFSDIKSKMDLKNKVNLLKKVSGGKPIGIKIAAGNIEADLDIVIFAQPDFITIDGRPGATGASQKFIKIATSIPTLFALYRARKYLDEKEIKDISLIITGGLRVSSDFAKAIAIGADAVAIATSALIACGCQQYRSCNKGNCPMGLATQNPELRARVDIDKSAKKVENFLNVSTSELKDFARLTGNNDIHKLSIKDLCTTNSEISNHTSIEHI